MLPNYDTRRSSVVFNPRGRVLGGLGEETGGGANEPGEGGNISGTEGGYAAGREIDAQIANENALTAAAKSLAETRASTRVVATIASKAALVGLSVVAGPVGTVIGFALQASGAIDRAIESAVNGRQLSYAGDIAEAEQALADARGAAGSDATFTPELNKIQANLDAAKKTGIQAAVTTLYQTYAKRNPDPAALVYWSNTFGPTITADEVLQFQQVLYANEPNLRPVATATTAQTSTNLALPIIAAVAGFLIFGG